MGGHGKDPHRPEGKKGAEEWHLRERPGGYPSEKEEYDQNLRRIQEGGGPATVPAEEQVGGSRPGVRSRVKEAVERREAREGE